MGGCAGRGGGAGGARVVRAEGRTRTVGVQVRWVEMVVSGAVDCVLWISVIASPGPGESADHVNGVGGGQLESVR